MESEGVAGVAFRWEGAHMAGVCSKLTRLRSSVMYVVSIPTGRKGTSTWYTWNCITNMRSIPNRS